MLTVQPQSGLRPFPMLELASFWQHDHDDMHYDYITRQPLQICILSRLDPIPWYACVGLIFLCATEGGDRIEVINRRHTGDCPWLLTLNIKVDTELPILSYKCVPSAIQVLTQELGWISQLSWYARIPQAKNKLKWINNWLVASVSFNSH